MNFKQVAKRTFFSFDYDDVKSFRANVVRNHHAFKYREDAGFFDASIWEEAERHGEASVKRLIEAGLERTSVTCVLIGTDTWRRRWVRYEILRSYERGNKLIGIHINGVRDKHGRKYKNGQNPFNYLGFWISESGFSQTFCERHEYKGEWEIYQDLPRRNGLNYAAKYCGKGFTLADEVPIYDWVEDEGFHNFARWIDDL